MRFQVLFHSPPGVLFAFPSQYWFTIGRSRVFSLGGWSPHLQTGCHVSRPTYRLLSTTLLISRTGLSPSTAQHSKKNFNLNRKAQAGQKHHISCNLQNRIQFVLNRFRSPLLTISKYFFLLLRLLRCFNSAGSRFYTNQTPKKKMFRKSH